MSPILQAALGSILRHFLTIAAGYLVAKGIWTQEEAMTYAAAAALGLLGVGWSVWQKSKTHALIEKALDMPQGSSLDQLKER